VVKEVAKRTSVFHRYGSQGAGNRSRGLTASGRTLSQISANSIDPIDVRKLVAERSSFSTDTVAKCRAIMGLLILVNPPDTILSVKTYGSIL
jgi:hypothetical protein